MSRDIRQTALSGNSQGAVVLKRKAFRAWLDYYTLLEEYRGSVCSLKNDHGFSVPVTSDERRLIDKKSRQLYEKGIMPLKGLMPDQIIREARLLALREFELNRGKKNEAKI
jgi:hypothetical protein